VLSLEHKLKRKSNGNGKRTWNRAVGASTVALNDFSLPTFALFQERETADEKRDLTVYLYLHAEFNASYTAHLRCDVRRMVHRIEYRVFFS
jgi:hypothetical protein